MSMLEAALAYARRGWPVFPCDPRQDAPGAREKRAKRPLVPGADKDANNKPIPKTGGLWRATTDDAQIRRWWSRTPDALIGVPTGAAIGAFVVDLDPRDGETVDDVMARLEAAVGELPGFPRIRSQTQSGGLHLWFALPANEPMPKNSAKRLKGVDWRGDGGYVIAPPSVMSDGAAYEWLLSPEVGDLPEPPAQLLDLIYQRGAFAPASKADPDAAWVDAERFKSARISLDDPAEKRVRQYALAALDRARADVAGAAKGARSDTLNAASYGVAPFVGLGVLSMREAFAALRDGADACGCNDNPTKRDDTIKRALEAGHGNTASLAAKLDEIREDARAKAERYAVRPPEPPLHDRVPDGPEGSRLDGSDDQAADPGDPGPQPSDDRASPASRAALRAKLIDCAGLDHSDTDNGVRLRSYFGDDLLVLAYEGARNTSFVTWTGTHWDMRTGDDAALRLAQKVGALIMREARFLELTSFEREAIEAYARGKLDDHIGEMAEWRKPALEAIDGYTKRQIARRKFGVSSKNKARLDAMLSCAAPHLTRPPEAFNAHPLRIATRGHTIEFVRDRVEGDSSAGASDLVVRAGHDRTHMMTRALPVDYDPAATCPRWTAFLDRFLPVPEVREFVQTFTGVGLTGVLLQKLVFHYGNGANGKSVFLEVITRVLGELAVTLQSETVTGMAERSAQAASPDLARLYGRWMVRIPELPENEPVRAALVKKLTGGEAIPARNLFKAQFEFRPVAKAHWSGNGFPKIDDTSDGIWRRLAVVHWPVKLAPHEQRNFDDVVGEFMSEASGILNWLIAGALRYLRDGLVEPDQVLGATQDYRDENDPIAIFVASCIEFHEGSSVTGREMYEAYENWSKESGLRPYSETKFGKILKTKLKREDGRVRTYPGVRLKDVPQPPQSAASRNPSGEWPE